MEQRSWCGSDRVCLGIPCRFLLSVVTRRAFHCPFAEFHHCTHKLTLASSQRLNLGLLRYAQGGSLDFDQIAFAISARR
jgi:hypothetical protein